MQTLGCTGLRAFIPIYLVPKKIQTRYFLRQYANPREVHDYVAKAETGKTGACHLFRHTMATLMLENGADIRYI